MGAPAPQTPVYNAYRVHFRSPTSAARSEQFLKDNKVVAGIFNACDDFFFDATVCMIRVEDLAELKKKPNRNSLLICQGTGLPNADWGERVQWPDLWLVENREEEEKSISVFDWMRAGAGAAVVFGNNSVYWDSHNGSFGHSHGDFPLQDVKGSLDSFTAGLVFSLMEELLGETLFDKTVVHLDREGLEMRPLRLGRAVQSGLAAMSGEGLDSVRSKLGEWRGPVPQSWGGRTR